MTRASASAARRSIAASRSAARSSAVLDASSAAALFSLARCSHLRASAFQSVSSAFVCSGSATCAGSFAATSAGVGVLVVVSDMVISPVRVVPLCRAAGGGLLSTLLDVLRHGTDVGHALPTSLRRQLRVLNRRRIGIHRDLDRV